MSDSTTVSLKIDRRSFLNQTAAAIAGAGILSSSAFSYARIKGANDRILLGHIGVGDRGTELAWIASQLKNTQNIEMAAVCDLWKVNRERAAKTAEQVYNQGAHRKRFTKSSRGPS